MRYSVNCNQCGQEFIAETETPGKQKFRCPYCGSVLLCQLGEDKPFRTKARSVLPLVDSRTISPKQEAKLPIAKVKVLAKVTSEKLQAMKQSIVEGTENVSQIAVAATNTTEEYLSKSSSKLQAFQEKYSDGNLWIFFGFSFAFILLIFVGLFICAQVVNFVYESHNLLFKEYIEMKNNLGF
ncbi:hypothetical protein [Prevotella ihumii]|uniref:hypothetical protein n=1 Tax=Prevotella ihumii TaxID=1917878 RepID=UPI000980A177|nr:hypothetical protein [Prevotella ihumii]